MQFKNPANKYGISSEVGTVTDNLITRVLVHAVLVALLLLAPWWVFFLAAGLAMGVLDFFAEVMLYGLFIDILFSPPDPFLGFPFITTLLLLITFILVEHVKLQVR